MDAVPNRSSKVGRRSTSEGIVLQKASVYSLLGKELAVSSEAIIDFSKLATGIYFIAVETDRGIVNKKAIKNHK